MTPHPYAVWCLRFDGTERLYQRYPTRDEATRVALALMRVGCPTRVAGPDELLEVASKGTAPC